MHCYRPTIRSVADLDRRGTQTPDLIDAAPRRDLAGLAIYLANIPPEHCASVWRAAVLEAVIDTLDDANVLTTESVRGLTGGLARCLNIATRQLTTHLTTKDAKAKAQTDKATAVLRTFATERRGPFTALIARKHLQTLHFRFGIVAVRAMLAEMTKAGYLKAEPPRKSRKLYPQSRIFHVVNKRATG